MKEILSLNDYQKGLGDGDLPGVFCKSCNVFSFHSSVTCNHCKSFDLDIKNIEPNGTIKTYTVIRVAADGFDAPFVIALVQTDSQIHVMGNLRIDPESASMELIGQRVSISKKDVNEDPYTKGVAHCLYFTLE
jgi:uncharacterized OB-fold protein